MSLGSALSAAMAGLHANQAAMAIISSNVANAQTPGYVSRTSTQEELASGTSSSVRVTGVSRELDVYIQSQLRTETSGAAYASQMASVLNQLQSAYGTPGAAGTLETSLSNLVASLQALSTSSGSSSAQTAVLSAAQSMAQTLNATTRSIQALRSNAEQSLAGAASAVNAATSQIAQINGQLIGMAPHDPTAATLMDQRDNAVNQLAQYLDIRTVTDSSNQTTIYTTGGAPLVTATSASQIVFDNRGSLNASMAYNSDPTKSSVGSLMLQLPNGGTLDLTGNSAIVSGKIAADLQLRDQTLTQAQTQIDQFAAALASSLSDTTTQGAPAASGLQSGFDLDLSGVQPGNSFDVTFTENATNTQRTIHVVRVDDPAALPLSNAGAPADTLTLGVNFSGGMASVVSQLNAALGGAGLAFSNTGSSLRVLNTPAATASVNASSTTTTATALATGSPAVALFGDIGSLYTGKITAAGSQVAGFAGRITINPALMQDPAKLTIYGSNTYAGDTTRSDYLYNQLVSAQSSYSAATGLGSSTHPFRSTLTSYLQQFLGQQSVAASAASQLQEGQSVVVSSLQSKFSSSSGVSIDNEMTNLISLQNAYAANAHVMSVVQTMMTDLLQSFGR